MIEEQFVSFDTARILKEAGFDVSCRYSYDSVGGFRWLKIGESTPKEWVPCPTQALAARWLREVHRIGLEVTSFWTLFYGVTWQYFICNIGNTFEAGVLELSDSKFSTYEEAFEEGLKRSLELIKK